MPNVAFTRPEYAALLPQYNLIRDAISGETTVKKRRTEYLPMPSPNDKSKENMARYDAYVKRAVFYNVTRNTLAGMIGQVFMSDPIIKLPAALAPVQANASGSGVSLIQESKKALAYGVAYSRAGLLVDYPQLDTPATAADIQSGKVRATITTYSPMEIINWRVIDRGAEEVLSLVVLAELYEFEDDGFEMKNAQQYRVLKLEQGTGEYVIELWQEPTPTQADGIKLKANGNFTSVKTIRPKGVDGQPLKDIPFTFIGSENNDPWPDNPNMYDLASINMAHYRNSADYEESCFVVGQPTPVVTGLDKAWYEEVLGKTIGFGSRGGIPLPVGASADLLQAESNTMIKEAMDTKERQMVALGAKIVEQKQVQRTAFEAKLESTAEGSTLSSTAKNVSSAFEWALAWAARFIGAPETGIEYQLNTDFDISRMTVEERKECVTEWSQGAITFEEMRATLRKAGVATVPDDVAKEQIASEQAEAMSRAVAEAAATAAVTDPNAPGNVPPTDTSKKDA